MVDSRISVPSGVSVPDEQMNEIQLADGDKLSVANKTTANLGYLAMFLWSNDDQFIGYVSGHTALWQPDDGEGESKVMTLNKAAISRINSHGNLCGKEKKALNDIIFNIEAYGIYIKEEFRSQHKGSKLMYLFLHQLDSIGVEKLRVYSDITPKALDGRSFYEQTGADRVNFWDLVYDVPKVVDAKRTRIASYLLPDVLK